MQNMMLVVSEAAVWGVVFLIDMQQKSRSCKPVWWITLHAMHSAATLKCVEMLRQLNKSLWCDDQVSFFSLFETV